MNTLLVFGIFVSLLFSIFFSVLETSFKAANKLQLELEGRLGNLAAQVMTFFAKRPAWFTGTTFIGTTLSLVAFGTLMSLLSLPLLQNVFPVQTDSQFTIILIQTAISAFIILVIAAVIPKTAIISNHIQVLNFLVIPFAVSFVALAVFTFPLLAISKFLVVRVFRSTDKRKKSPFKNTDLRPYTNTVADTIPKPEDIEL